jgi:hypothetical protein
MASCSSSCQRPTSVPEKTQSSKNIVQKDKECPFRMSDGRNFTDYRPMCTIDYQNKQKNNFKSSYEERQYFIQNASKMMEQNENNAKTSNNCLECFSGTMLPEKNMTQCNKKVCSFNTQDPSGLGTGRNYNSL